MNPPATIFFFPNGNTAVCDESGTQIPELQESWLLVYLSWLEKTSGFKANTIREINLPDGRKAKLFSTDMGLNWRILK